MKINLKSVEDVSVRRKFVIFFVLLSVVPFIILFSLFFMSYFSDDIKGNAALLFWSFFIVGFFMFITFMAISRTLGKINIMSKKVVKVVAAPMPEKIEIKMEGDNEIVQIARSFNEVVQKLEGSVRELERSKTILQDVLTKVSSGISFTENINAFLDLIMKTMVGALDAKSGLLLLLNGGDRVLTLKSYYGVEEAVIRKENWFGEDIGALGYVIQEKKPLLVPRIPNGGSVSQKGLDSGFNPPLLCVPLVYQNEAIGVIIISGKEKVENFKEDELLIASNISSQVSMAIVNARLNADAQKTYMETITALAMAVEARDLYSRGHSDRVCALSVKIAYKMGLSENQIKIVKEAAQLHDVGKIGIPDDILRKPGSLDEGEFEAIRQHPAIGEGIIIPLHGFFPLRDPIRHHHEWLDGTGYPDHLKGDDISIETRILTACDAYDAMTSNRPYRKAFTLEQAKAELIRFKDTRYDSNVLDALFFVI